MNLKRIGFVLIGGSAVAASYVAILFALGSDPQLEGSTLATIAFPALVAGLTLTAYIAWDSRQSRETRGAVTELSAQLVRREIELDRLSTVDELTGLYTRHHFDENVRLEYKRCERYARPLSLLLIEIDDLVELGEHVGKLSKGYLLSEVGAILRTLLRANDLGCRYANECMAVLLPETNAGQAALVAEKVRALMAEHEFLGFGEGVHVTVSQGIATAPARGVRSHLDLIRSCESALADARAAGFDQIQRADGDGDEESSAGVAPSGAKEPEAQGDAGDRQRLAS